MQITHDILIRTGEEYAEVVGFAVEGVKGEVVVGIRQIDERVYLTVGIARDVDQRGVDGGLFAEAMKRRNGEQLFERPVVEERLED